MSTIETTTTAMPPAARPVPRYSARPAVPATAAKRRARGVLKPLLKLSALHIVLTIVSLLMILPLIWMVLTSFKTLDQVGDTRWLIPDGWSALARIARKNYSAVFQQIPFARFYWNSIFVAAWTTFLQVLTSAMAAFSFSRLKWPGRDRVFWIYLSTMMLPGLVMMIPNYLIMIDLRLLDTFTGLILPASFSAFGTFLLRQFMLGIPQSLDEAAQIDGAGKWRLFWDIILPMSKPGVITLAILVFMGNYNSFFWPLVVLKSVHKYTLPIGLLYFDSTQGQTTHLLMAATTMSIVPMVVVFVALQRYLVKGIHLGAVKG